LAQAAGPRAGIYPFAGPLFHPSGGQPVSGWEGPPCVLVPPVVWCPPAGPPRCCVPPCGGRVPRVLPPLAVGSCPVCWCPPRCCGPDQDHCYDRLEATALHRIHSLAPCRHQGSGHPHATGCVSGGLGRCTSSSTAHSRRSVSRAVVQQPVAATATAPLPTW